MTITPKQLLNHWEGFNPADPDGRIQASPLVDPENKSSFLFAGKLKNQFGIITPLLLLRLPISLTRRSPSIREFNGIELALIEDQRDTSYSFLALSLTAQEYYSVFAVLCSDVATSVLAANNDRKRYNCFLERIALWGRLFDSIRPDGLTSIEQRGLFAELCFLRYLLEASVDPAKVVDAWTGLRGGSHDFRFGSVAIEVKSSAGNGNQIRISSEHQLDISNVGSLFLVQIILNVNSSTGITLNAFIDRVRELIKDSPRALFGFNRVLLESGYFDIHRAFYEETYYEIRKSNYWHVTGSFPRIDPSFVPLEGISEVSYLVSVDHLTKFSVQLNTVVDTINQNS